MPFYGKRSLLNLSEGEWYLQKIVQRVITKVNCSIIDCHRPKIEQELAFSDGKSKAHFGESPHNLLPAEAVDVIPCPFKGWNDKEGFTKIKISFEESLLELIFEDEIPSDYELEYGFDWGWDNPHIQNKNWRKA